MRKDGKEKKRVGEKCKRERGIKSERRARETTPRFLSLFLSHPLSLVFSPVFPPKPFRCSLLVSLFDDLSIVFFSFSLLSLNFSLSSPPPTPSPSRFAPSLSLNTPTTHSTPTDTHSLLLLQDWPRTPTHTCRTHKHMIFHPRNRHATVHFVMHVATRIPFSDSSLAAGCVGTGSEAIGGSTNTQREQPDAYQMRMMVPHILVFFEPFKRFPDQFQRLRGKFILFASAEMMQNYEEMTRVCVG